MSIEVGDVFGENRGVFQFLDKNVHERRLRQSVLHLRSVLSPIMSERVHLLVTQPFQPGQVYNGVYKVETLIGLKVRQS